MATKTVALDKVKFKKREGGSKYDQYVDPILCLDEGKSLLIDIPTDIAFQSFVQGIRSAVLGNGIPEGFEDYKLNTRKTEDGQLAAFWTLREE